MVGAGGRWQTENLIRLFEKGTFVLEGHTRLVQDTPVLEGGQNVW